MFNITLLLGIVCVLNFSDAIFEIRATSRCSDNEVPFQSICKPANESYLEAYDFLLRNLPSWDKTNAASLGFHNTTGEMVDGLEDGIATLGINISIATKQVNSWAFDVTEEVFHNYVVPYAHVNEARNNWRPFLTNVVNNIFAANPGASLYTVADVVYLLNDNLWSTGILGNKVVFKSSQTPLIYDPMSTIVFGYASCTGVSILLADALRAAGVAARIAGTPAWNLVEENGNHNWVEVWDPMAQEWSFIEAAPAGPGETLVDPCDKWFCTPERMKNGTEVFATSWMFDEEETVYPLAWDRGNREIPGVDRTAYYQNVCNKC